MNYGELKLAIANRLSRTNLTAIIPDFVTLGEARLYSGFKDIEVQVPPLRIQQMLTTASTIATLPSDFLELDRFTVPGSYSPQALEYKTPQDFASLATSANNPKYYTFQSGGVSVEGGVPASFVFSYYKRFPALVADADTNWLLTNYPIIYLYSALIEAYAHIKDDARIVTAARMYAAAANALIDSDKAARHSGSVLTVQTGRT